MKHIPETEFEWRAMLLWPAMVLGKGTRERGVAIRGIAAATHPDLLGRPRKVSENTLRRWLRNIEAGGVVAIRTPTKIGKTQPQKG